MRTNSRACLAVLTSALVFAALPAEGRVDCNEGLRALDATADSRLTAQDFISEIAAKETALSRAFATFGYRLEVVVQTLKGDEVDGEFRQALLSEFDDTGARRDRLEGETINTLKRIKFSESDVWAFRDTLPFTLTMDKLADRDIVYSGRQAMGDVRLHVFDILPRHGVDRERAFLGRTWVRGRTMGIVRTCGRSPGFPIARMRYEVIRGEVPGSDDYLPFSIRADEDVDVDGEKVHVRINVTYRNYSKKRP